jgi:exodeoxyribonuclease V beta subunit
MNPVDDPLDVFGCPLDGIRLIEASAGTGKTWNLCVLVLRLLLERGLALPQVLVVTYTNAAAAELRERIRQRLAGTLAHLRGTQAPAGDPFVPRLVDSLRRQGHADDTMARRLALALAGFDEASIFTIHAFCQRALADAPFTAGLPLAGELLPDDSDIVQGVANDFWRRRVLGDAIAPWLAARLLRQRDTPERFAGLLRRQQSRPSARCLWPRSIDDAGEPDAHTLGAAR